jgi:hypothetical protein
MTTNENWRAELDADPRVAAWRARVAADRPPLTPEQIAILRPIFAPVIQHMRAEAGRRAEAAATGRQDPAPGCSRSLPLRH